MMTNDINPEWSHKCFTVLLNEVAPRAKKLNITPKDFWDARVIAYITRLEFEKVITRKELRQILDLRVKELNNEEIHCTI